MHPFVWIAALVGGVAVWRRKTLKDDAEKVKTAAIEAKTVASEKIASARGGASDDTEGDAGEAEAAVEDAADEATSA